jgi:hypothetical protein
MLGEHLASGLVKLAKERGLVARCVHPEFNAADASEKASYPQAAG